MRWLRQQGILHRLINRQKLGRLLRLLDARDLLVIRLLELLASVLFQNLCGNYPQILLTFVLHREVTGG